MKTINLFIPEQYSLVESKDYSENRSARYYKVYENLGSAHSGLKFY